MRVSTYDVLLRKYARVRTVMMIGTALYFATLAFFLVFSRPACSQVFTPDGGVVNTPLKKAETKKNKPAALPKPRPPQETARLVPPGQTSGWYIHTQTDPTDPNVHFSCIAVPRAPDAAPVRIIYTAEKGSLVIMTVGLDFDLPEHVSAPGAFRIDKGPVYQLWARAVPTTEETLFFLGEPNKDQLQQFDSGQILTLVTNEKGIRIDLTSTKGLIAQLMACNAQGQESLNKGLLDKGKIAE